MRANYTVEEGPEGWRLVEDDALLGVFDEQGDALRLAYLLAHGSMAAGGQAKLRVVTREGAGPIVNLDQPPP